MYIKRKTDFTHFTFTVELQIHVLQVLCIPNAAVTHPSTSRLYQNIGIFVFANPLKNNWWSYCGISLVVVVYH